MSLFCFMNDTKPQNVGLTGPKSPKVIFWILWVLKCSLLWWINYLNLYMVLWRYFSNKLTDVDGSKILWSSWNAINVLIAIFSSNGMNYKQPAIIRSPYFKRWCKLFFYCNQVIFRLFSQHAIFAEIRTFFWGQGWWKRLPGSKK